MYSTIDGLEMRISELEQQLAEAQLERNEIAQAVRFAPSSARWSNVLVSLLGKEARAGIDALELQLAILREAFSFQQKCNTELEAKLAAYKQDAERLVQWMLSEYEWNSKEMTKQQFVAEFVHRLKGE